MNSSSQDWVVVSSTDLNQVETKEQRGIKLEFMFSPADLPTAWRVISEDSGIDVVEFKYLSDNEPKKLERQGDGVVLEVGKNSKRIYKIILRKAALFGENSVVIGNAADTISHADGLNPNNSTIIRRFLSSEASKSEIVEKLRA